MPNSFFTFRIVETDLFVSLATFRIEYPFLNREIASLYSSLFCSRLFLLPGLRPNLPPFSIYNSRPLLRRSMIPWRSIAASSPNKVVTREDKGFTVLSGRNVSKFKFWMYTHILCVCSISSAFKISKVERPKREISDRSSISTWFCESMQYSKQRLNTGRSTLAFRPLTFLQRPQPPCLPVRLQIFPNQQPAARSIAWQIASLHVNK